MREANPLMRLHGLPDLRLRRARLREVLLANDEELVEWLCELVSRAHVGDGQAALSLVSWGSLMAHARLDPVLTEAMDRFRLRAPPTDAAEAETPSRLFFAALTGPATHRVLSFRVRLDGGGSLRGQHRVQSPWQPSYHGKQFTRPHPHVLFQAYRHDDSRFRKLLLSEPWICERDVVNMAALRPSTEAMLLTIAQCDRWFFCERVREALGANPYTPSWLVATLLPTLPHRTRRALRSHRDAKVAALAEAWEG
jgi:hypothetical protein